MAPFVWLTEVQSSAVQILLVLGIAMVLPTYVNRHSTLHRSLLFGIGVLLALRYVWWRGTETLAPFGLTLDCLASWSLYALELAAMASAVSAAFLMSRIRERSAEADANMGWWAEEGEDPDEKAPKVAVMIATYNEGIEVLERTIIGAMALDYPNKEVMVLDDGKREWLRTFCAQHGARHITRPDNSHAKAGNINHALAMLAKEPEPPAFVSILDADFVPHSHFIRRALALFHASDVGLVQTPQHFFNADPVQHNLGVSRSYPDEQRFFFDHLQPARDGWGLAICCGTSSVMRWEALQAIGGFPTESVTEDFLLTLALQEIGWRTAYLNEPLTEGLAPEGLKEYVTQRARWCLGLMQIARSRLGPLGDNALRLRDRWSVSDSVLYWLTSFAFRIAGLIYPLLYWYFNIIVVNAAVPDVLSYFGVYFIWSMMTMNTLSRGMTLPILSDVSQLLGAIPITKAAVVGIIKPHGHAFSVTAKGGDRSKVVVQWGLMRPFLILFVLTVVGLSLAMVSDRFAYYDAGDGKSVVLFWTTYNLVVIGATMLACIELPRSETHVADAPERAIFIGEGPPKRV